MPIYVKMFGMVKKPVIAFSAASHIGIVRGINQDNLLCCGRYIETQDKMPFTYSGRASSRGFALFGVFDGVGGGEYGEIASRLAAEMAAKSEFQSDFLAFFSKYCHSANVEICRISVEKRVSFMGTTVALLAFSNRQVAWCNIGDSKIFCFKDGALKQLSCDHLGIAPVGRKSPLSQYLGVDPHEMIIEPNIGSRRIDSRELYLLCTDGLTDVMTRETLCQVIENEPFEGLSEKLVDLALNRGAKDNITVILCKIQN